MVAQPLESLDRVLDDLDRLARSGMPSGRFYPLLLERLLPTVGAGSAAIVVPVAEDNWSAIAAAGELPNDLVARFTERARQVDPSARVPLLTLQPPGIECWAIPIRTEQPRDGCLLALFPSSPSGQARVAMLELLEAFVELIRERQTQELESFFVDDYRGVQQLAARLAASPSLELASRQLVCGLQGVLGAARVSLFDARRGRARIVACSSSPSIDPRSETVHGLGLLAAEILSSGVPRLRQQPYRRDAAGEMQSPMDDQGIFENLIATPWTDEASSDADWALIVEYREYESMMQRIGRLHHLLSGLSTTWTQQTRWLALPGWLRRLPGLRTRPKLLRSKIVRPLLAATVIAGLAWALLVPYPLRIEAEGVYEPQRMRGVYATEEGFVAELLVTDGQRVGPGTAVARLRSPALELQIEQTQGELNAIEEEASGIRVAINQVVDDAPLNDQSQLAARIAELETRRENLRAQLELLRVRQEQLTLLSPIRGYVIARDLEQHLAGRPVQHGDPLFTIVDLEGDWHLRLQIADRDTEYVLQHYDTGEAAPGEVQFVFESRPDEPHSARVAWIADHLENRDGTGTFLEVRCDTRAAISHQVGAGVRAYFTCGERPLWFVWCRPIVESAQRRLWF